MQRGDLITRKNNQFAPILELQANWGEWSIARSWAFGWPIFVKLVNYRKINNNIPKDSS